MSKYFPEPRLARVRGKFSRAAAAAFALSCIALPGRAAIETVVSSVADCRPVGGIGRWSNPSNWVPGQTPDNRKPGVTYNVSVPGDACLSMILDVSATVNELTMAAGYWSGSTEKRAVKASAAGITLTVLKDARIDELGMTNGKLAIGGTLWLGSANGGWQISSTQIKSQDLREDGFAAAHFSTTSIDVARRALITEYAWTELTDSTLETADLSLVNGALSLAKGSTLKVKNNFDMNSASWLGVLLDGSPVFTINSSATLAGTLQCWLTEGYIPAIGEQFTILTSRGSLNGNWNNILLPQLPPDRAWNVINNNQSVLLRVIPAP